MARARLEAEFGCYSTWVVDAIQQIGFADRIPAACRGTGNPALLEHLAGNLGITAGSTLLDIGIGLGGPGAWLVRARSCRVFGIDLMVESARGARSLFPELMTAVSTTRAMPFESATFDAAWALGVIEMIADKRRAFQEIVRVLVPGARVVIYDFVATGFALEDPPAASRFEPAEDINRKLEESGLNLVRTSAVPELSPPPDAWQRAVTLVRDRVDQRHGRDPRLALAEEGRARFNRLRQQGSIREWEFVAEKPRA
jgi:SAM-dependent methyltransferase